MHDERMRDIVGRTAIRAGGRLLIPVVHPDRTCSGNTAGIRDSHPDQRHLIYWIEPLYMKLQRRLVISINEPDILAVLLYVHEITEVSNMQAHQDLHIVSHAIAHFRQHRGINNELLAEFPVFMPPCLGYDRYHPAQEACEYFIDG